VQASTRDELVDWVRYWSARAELPIAPLLGRLGISVSRYYDWCARYGRLNAHNAPVPRRFWLLPTERQAILDFQSQHPDQGYRRLCYMMLDADVVAVSPSSVYRVLKEAGRIGSLDHGLSLKGQGFEQPDRPHEHWHMDISYLNICATFYYLCTILDGYSRYIVHWEIRETMTEADVETILQRGREAVPGAAPRIISDNGPQFVAREFKEFIRLCGMTHVRTSPYYPQSNGKVESWHKTIKRECIRPLTPLSLEDAHRIVAGFVREYNRVRLHSGIGYVTPQARLEGRDQQILAERHRKLAAARLARETVHRQVSTEGVPGRPPFYQPEPALIASVPVVA
jgi:transposase InsO family protein